MKHTAAPLFSHSIYIFKAQNSEQKTINVLRRELISSKIILAAVGFEPTPPKRLVPKTSAVDRSATLPVMSTCHAVNIWVHNYQRVLINFSKFCLEKQLSRRTNPFQQTLKESLCLDVTKQFHNVDYSLKLQHGKRKTNQLT